MNFKQSKAIENTMMDSKGNIHDNTITRGQLIEDIVPRLDSCKTFYHPGSNEPFVYFKEDRILDKEQTRLNKRAFIRVAKNSDESAFLFKKSLYLSRFEIDTEGFFETVYYDSYGVPVISTNPNSTLCTGVPDHSYVKYLKVNKVPAVMSRCESASTLTDNDEAYNNADGIEAGEDEHYESLLQFLASEKHGIQEIPEDDIADTESIVSTPFSDISSDDGYFDCNAAKNTSKITAAMKELDLKEGSSNYPPQDPADLHFRKFTSVKTAEPQTQESVEEHEEEEHHDQLVDFLLNRRGIFELLPTDKDSETKPTKKWPPKLEKLPDGTTDYNARRHPLEPVPEELMDPVRYEAFVNRLFDRFGYMHDSMSKFY